MNLIFYAAGAVLMILGAVDLVRQLSFWLHNGGGLRGEKGRMALVLMPAGPEECESLVRAGGQRVEWMSLKPPCRLICLDSGDGTTRELAERLRRQYSNLEVCGLEELAERLAAQADSRGRGLTRS